MRRAAGLARRKGLELDESAAPGAYRGLVCTQAMLIGQS
jgi:hypothetical protein